MMSRVPPLWSLIVLVWISQIHGDPNLSPTTTPVKTSTTPLPTMQCPKYSCGTFPQSETPSCYRVINSSLVILARCPAKSHCSVPYEEILHKSNVNQNETFFCEHENDQKFLFDLLRLPGEQCEKNEDCHTSHCENKVCVGASEGASCGHDHKNCSLGLACIEGKCSTQRNEGQKCTNIFECANGLFCSTTGTCRPYFSIPIGEKTSHKFEYCEHGNFSNECESHYASCNNTCATPPRSLQNYNATHCNSNDDCGLSENAKGRCSCGFNIDGKAFCEIAQGDPIYNKIASVMKEIATKNEECHTVSRFNPHCSNITDKAYYLEDLITMALHWHKIAYTPLCYKDTFEALFHLKDRRMFEDIPHWEPMPTGEQKNNFNFTGEDIVFFCVIATGVIALLCLLGVVQYIMRPSTAKRSKLPTRDFNESMEMTKLEVIEEDVEREDSDDENVGKPVKKRNKAKAQPESKPAPPLKKKVKKKRKQIDEDKEIQRSKEDEHLELDEGDTDNL